MTNEEEMLLREYLAAGGEIEGARRTGRGLSAGTGKRGRAWTASGSTSKLWIWLLSGGTATRRVTRRATGQATR